MTDSEAATGDVSVSRLLPNICTDQMEATRDFYASLLGFVVGFEHEGWYLQLASPTDPQLQIGILRRDHEFTPAAFQRPAQGVVISVQVEDVDRAYAAVKARGVPISLTLRDEDFGMRRFMVADPNEVLVNLFSFP